MTPTRQKPKKTIVEITYPDKGLVMLVIGLLLSGLLVIYSSTVIHSQMLFNNPYRFVLLQLGWIIIGLIGFVFFYRYNYQDLHLLAYLFMAGSLVSLVLTGLAGILPCKWSIGFVPCINEANRWLILNPSPLPKLPIIGELGFQPSELAKLALILYLSFKLPSIIKKGTDAFFIYIVSTGLLSGLIMLQPNMSTAVLVFLIGTIVYFCSGASLRPLYVLIPLLVCVGIFFILMSPYRRERLTTFITKNSGNVDSQELSSGYHIKQVSIALGSGGLFGVGFGQSKQKYYLPEVSSDSIFAVIGEEFGFIGSLLSIFAFCFFVYKGFSISRKLSDPSCKLLAVGITSWLALQFIIHVAANTSLIPYTGVPIPLISYGGSSMMFSMMALGILVGLSRSSEKSTSHK